MEEASTSTLGWLRRIVGLLLLILVVQAGVIWQNHRTYRAVTQENEMPSQTTKVPIEVQGVETTTTVTTTMGEPPHQTETEAQWIARHIATCAAIKTAWENAGQ